MPPSKNHWGGRNAYQGAMVATHQIPLLNATDPAIGLDQEMVFAPSWGRLAGRPQLSQIAM